MDLPAGYAFRAPDRADLDDLAQLLIADQQDASNGAVLGPDFIENGWNRPGFDLAGDAWVVVDMTGTIAAYGQASWEEPGVIQSWGVVDPKHRGRGIGSALIDRIEGRALELEPRRFRHSINLGDDAAAALLSARALQPVRHFWHMEIALDGAVDGDSEPPGIDIRAVESREDVATVHGVLDAAFANDWGYHPEPFDRWVEGYSSRPTFDPRLWLLARDARTPVGALTADVHDERGWINELGVLASHRGRGIGAALLRRSFAGIKRRGVRHATLNVDAENPTGATVLYERVGLRVVNRWAMWERQVEKSG
jgi:mycothiol synthase